MLLSDATEVPSPSSSSSAVDSSGCRLGLMGMPQVDVKLHLQVQHDGEEPSFIEQESLSRIPSLSAGIAASPSIPGHARSSHQLAEEWSERSGLGDIRGGSADPAQLKLCCPRPKRPSPALT